MVAEIPAAERLSTPPAWALACVPGLEHGEPPRALMPLAGGSVNQVFRVDSGSGRFVLRLDGAAWRRPGVDRTRELTPAPRGSGRRHCARDRLCRVRTCTAC